MTTDSENNNGEVVAVNDDGVHHDDHEVITKDMPSSSFLPMKLSYSKQYKTIENEEEKVKHRFSDP